MKRKGGKLLAVILMAASVFSACGAEEQAQKEASDISVEETVDSAETETAVLMDETLRFQGEGTQFSVMKGDCFSFLWKMTEILLLIMW